MKNGQPPGSQKGQLLGAQFFQQPRKKLRPLFGAPTDPIAESPIFLKKWDSTKPVFGDFRPTESYMIFLFHVSRSHFNFLQCNQQQHCKFSFFCSCRFMSCHACVSVNFHHMCMIRIFSKDVGPTLWNPLRAHYRIFNLQECGSKLGISTQ